MHSNPQALAELAGKTMYERDPASQALGMKLDEIRPGYARMSMAVRGDMLNGHQTCHGGYIFMLADSAFAFACNSQTSAPWALAARSIISRQGARATCWWPTPPSRRCRAKPASTTSR